ncbi:unnamed protein product, partial [Allacma fusca]
MRRVKILEGTILSKVLVEHGSESDLGFSNGKVPARFGICRTV